MSSYSDNLGIELITNGTQAGVWGTTTNTNLGTLIEQAISGYVTQAVSGGTTTITMPNGATGVARNMYLRLTGTGGGVLEVPAKQKLYFIYNNTGGGLAVTVKVSGQTGVSVPDGTNALLVCNGTDVVSAINYIPLQYLASETYSTSSAVTAGTNAQGQGALTSDINVITSASANPSGVTLPTATTGRIVTIINKGANAINVYPATSAYIDGLSVNTSIQIPVGSSLQFIASATDQWYSSATGDTGSGANVRAVAPNLSAETYSTSATVAATGTVQGDAAALTSDFNIVTSATSIANGVILPTATTGRRIIIINKDASDSINIYPASGASIDTLSTNAAFSLPVNGWLELNASSTSKWYSSYNAYTDPNVYTGSAADNLTYPVGTYLPVINYTGVYTGKYNNSTFTVYRGDDAGAYVYTDWSAYTGATALTGTWAVRGTSNGMTLRAAPSGTNLIYLMQRIS